MAFLAGDLAAEGDLADLFHELDRFAVLTDGEFPLFHCDIGSDCGEFAAEHHFRGVLGNVDKAAAADDIGAQSAYVDVAFGVHLRHADTGGIQPTAVIKIEHDGL
ncbi:MAG: hypothetical protein BWY09_02539 [Candidatus Hydrogenedentes bacterium ADurb.Bin179]|nr:MAG: hypothetical protein BWY09_02539 [Candidatus Hydrogenedentes bacterium ADurb.Bin179]